MISATLHGLVDLLYSLTNMIAKLGDANAQRETFFKCVLGDIQLSILKIVSERAQYLAMPRYWDLEG